MTPGAPIGGSAYETWVLTLRAFADDPTVPLDHLPQLADDTFSPATYQRLVGCLTTTLETIAHRWATDLRQAFARAGSLHELSVELVRLRPRLARQLQLAGHPGLPPALREVLLRRTRESITEHQREIEAAVARDVGRGRLEGRGRDELVRAVRECSVERLLSYADVAGEAPQAAPLPMVPPARGARRTGFTRPGPRRVVHPPIEQGPQAPARAPTQEGPHP